MKTFSPEVREAVMKAQNGFCIVEGCYKPICDFDHIIPNTKTNNKLFPLFLHSPFNCQGTDRQHHIEKKKYGKKITYNEAEVYENYLRSL